MLVVKVLDVSLQQKVCHWRLTGQMGRAHFSAVSLLRRVLLSARNVWGEGEKGRCCSKNHPLHIQHSRGVFCWCWSSFTDSSKHEESTLAYTRIFTMALSSHSSTPTCFKACKLGTLTEKQKQKPTVLSVMARKSWCTECRTRGHCALITITAIPVNSLLLHLIMAGSPHPCTLYSVTKPTDLAVLFGYCSVLLLVMLGSKTVTGAFASVTEHCTVATYGSTAGKQAPDGTYISVTVPLWALGTMWKNKPNHPQNWKTL